MEKNQEDSEDDQIDTNHCPVCSKKCKKLLLHLNKAENCKTNVCPDFHLKLQQMSKGKRERKKRARARKMREKGKRARKIRENLANWRISRSRRSCTPSWRPFSAATATAPLLSPPPADTETLPAFLEQGEVEVARSPGPTPPYPGYQPATTWAGPDLNTYTLTEAEAGSVAECEELALEYSSELPSCQDLAPAATLAGPDLNPAEEFELSFLAPVHG